MYDKIKSISKINLPLDLLRIRQGVAYLLFVKDYLLFRSLSASAKQRFQLKWSDRYPCLEDKTATTDFDRHYIYHPAWASRILARTKPEFHIDISSTLYFCSIVSAFIPMKFYDYRPPKLLLDNLHVSSADLVKLPFEDGSISSLSCMHVVEHVGLGRYGDPLDPNGDLKAIAELKRVMSPESNLLFVVPIGGLPGIMFNAHRIYSYKQIVSYFSNFELKDFWLMRDNNIAGGLIYNASRKMADKCKYGCGCFWFARR